MNKVRAKIRSSSTIEMQKRRPAWSPKNRDMTERPPGVQKAEARVARSKGAMIQRSGSYARTAAKDNDLLYQGDTISTGSKGEAVVKPRGGPRFSVGKMGMTKVTK